MAEEGPELRVAFVSLLTFRRASSSLSLAILVATLSSCGLVTVSSADLRKLGMNADSGASKIEFSTISTTFVGMADARAYNKGSNSILPVINPSHYEKGRRSNLRGD